MLKFQHPDLEIEGRLISQSFYFRFYEVVSKLKLQKHYIPVRDFEFLNIFCNTRTTK